MKFTNMLTSYREKR